MSTTNTTPAVNESDLIRALDKLFEKDGWEIPDHAITSQQQQRIASLESKVKELSAAVAALAKPGLRGRVDALESK